MAQLYFYYSTMNAGKSTSLLQSAYNYEERGMKTLAYTANIDDRDKQGHVSSRIGLHREAELFSAETNLFEEIKQHHNDNRISCVLLDESQFLNKSQVQQLTDVVDELKIPVLCYGIRTDFLGELFDGSKYLLAWADKLIELKTICHCGKKATMVVRHDQNGKVFAEGSQIEVGGNERYVAFCRKHFKQAIEEQSIEFAQK